jgi:GT2 family glycosyltransferase
MSFQSTRKKINEFFLAGQKKIKNITWIKRNSGLSKSKDFKYQQWINENEAIVLSYYREWKYKPLITVLLFSGENHIDFQKTILSVAQQRYDLWELVVVAPKDDWSEILAFCKGAKIKLSKNEVTFQESFFELSKSFEAPLNAVAKGEWIIPIAAGNLLAPSALYWVAKECQENPSLVMIYSDEDELGNDFLRINPKFKSSFNPELMLSRNMVGDLVAYRTSALREKINLKSAFNKYYFYDLNFQIYEKFGPENIIRIPKILFHRRSYQESFQDNQGQADNLESIQIVKAHLARTHRNGQVENLQAYPQFTKVQFQLPNPLPLVTIIIPMRDKVDFTRNCILSIQKLTTYPNYEIIIIDNNSQEAQTIEYLNLLDAGKVRVISDKQAFNFSAINNRAVKEMRGTYLCFMNNDIEVLTPSWLEEMMGFATQPDIGCVGAKLWYPNWTLQHGGIILGIAGFAGHAHKFSVKGEVGYLERLILPQVVSAVTAACLVVRRSIFDSVNGFDEGFTVALNDVDLCLRINRAGFRNVWTPFAEMMHHESISRGHEDDEDKKERFKRELQLLQKRWGSSLLNDPYYNKNLTLELEDCSIVSS